MPRWPKCRWHWLAQVLDRIPGYKINRLDELLPWDRTPDEDREADV